MRGRRAWRGAWLAVGVCLALAVSGARAEPRFAAPEQDVERVFQLLAQRLSLMPEVAAQKWRQKLPVLDAAREREVLEKTAVRAKELGIEPGSARALLGLQMELARAVQGRCVQRWERGEATPPESRDLKSVLRPELDRLSDALLRALVLALPALARPEFAAQHKAAAEAVLAAQELEVERAGALLSALSALAPEPGTRLSRIRAAGVLRVGTTGDYAPFSSDRGDVLAGLDIDLVHGFAKSLGVEVEFVRTTWPTLMADYAKDAFDIAASGISITEERAKLGRFSAPYHTGGKTPLARCTARARFGSLAAIDQPTVRVVVNPGGTNEQFARASLRAAQLVVFPDNRAIFSELVEGRADVMITDDVEAELQHHKHPSLCRTMRGLLSRADKAWLLADDAELARAVDGWLVPRVRRGEIARALQRKLRQSE